MTKPSIDASAWTPAPRGTRLAILTLWLGVCGIVTYWSIFLVNLPTADWDRCYVEHELPFPVADALLAICAAVAAEATRRGRPTALLWGLWAASGFGFLAVLDVTYVVQRGGYQLTADSLGNLWANLFCAGAAIGLSRFYWRHRLTLVTGLGHSR